jgi:glycosyltransferase involved in cell wall biosynthesis
LIVVDDGWVDKDLLRRTVGDHPSTRIIQHPPAGVARSRNHGLAESNGSLLAFLDHDDLWHPEHLASLVAALATDPTASASYGHIDTIDADGKTIAQKRTRPTTPELVIGGGPRPSLNSLLVRREHIAKVGGFEPLVDPADDVDMIYKLVREGPFVFSDAVTVYYRRHGDSISRDIVLMAEAADRMLRLHESAAKGRGDEETARLFSANRIDVKMHWTAIARHKAFEELRAGNVKEAKRLLHWCARFAPRALVRDTFHGVGGKLKKSA